MGNRIKTTAKWLVSVCWILRQSTTSASDSPVMSCFISKWTPAFILAVNGNTAVRFNDIVGGVLSSARTRASRQSTMRSEFP